MEIPGHLIWLQANHFIPQIWKPRWAFLELAQLHHCNLSLSWVTSKFLLKEKIRSQVIDIVHNFVSQSIKIMY